MKPSIVLPYPLSLASQGFRQPSLNKIATWPQTNSLYCAYSDGKVLHFNTTNNQLSNVFTVYDNTDVIDVEVMGNNLLATCTHNEVTLFDMMKNRSLSLKVTYIPHRDMRRRRSP